MRVSLEAGDRTLLIVAGVLLVAMIVAGVLLMPPDAETAPTRVPSSYSATSEGAKAAFLLLEDLGFDVKRWTDSPDRLPVVATDTVLILADPSTTADPEERRQIEQFVRRGGRVLLTGLGAASIMPPADLGVVPTLPFGWVEFPAGVPGPASRDAGLISMKSFVRWRRPRPAYIPVYADETGPVVVSARMGRGEIIWWASASPLTNYGLTRADNFKLFLNSVGNPKKTHVLWDEYFHGMRAGLFDYLAETPLPWALAQALVVFLAILLTFGRRSGPVAVNREESRLTPLEFVETVGDLYERKDAAEGAVEVAFERFRFLLERRLGLASPASFEALDRAMASHGGWPDLELRETLRKCPQMIKTERLGTKQALSVIQLLHDFTRRLRLGRIGG